MNWRNPMSKIYIEDIWASDVFDWMFKACMDWSGDGGATLVCKNYKDVALKFKNYLADKHDLVFDVYNDKKNNYVNLSRYQEGFTFTDNPNINTFEEEYIFIVNKTCRFSKDKSISIIGLNDV
jgi:hypothetical protein